MSVADDNFLFLYPVAGETIFPGPYLILKEAKKKAFVELSTNAMV